MDTPYVKTTKQVAGHFHVDIETGLTYDQHAKQRDTFGPNEIEKEESTSMWTLILEQFKDQLVLMLLVAAAVSFVLAFVEEHADATAATTAFVEPLVILLILVANATVGVLQESSAEKAIEALMAYSPDEATVRRQGSWRRVHSGDLVPGDVIQISVGDKIPADARVVAIHTSVLRIDQAILTGESESVLKTTNAIKDRHAVKQDQINMLFSGTTCVLGKATAIVVATGAHTAIGHIHTSIVSQISEKTPLKRRLDDFGDMLAKVIAVICLLVWLINIRHFNDPAHHGWLKGAVYYFKIAVALAVAAIPEGLAAVITACLALGTKRMATCGAIVRSLPSVETLGCTSVICSDKTGTLTTNQMSVAKVLVVGGPRGRLDEYNVEGTSYAPEGTITMVGRKEPADALLLHQPLFKEISLACTFCNDARIVYDKETDAYTCIGEPTEAALKVLAEKMGTDEKETHVSLATLDKSGRVSAVHAHHDAVYERVLTLEFTRQRKSMSVVVQGRASSAMPTKMYVKGAPESILERCAHVMIDNGDVVTLTEAMRDKVLARVAEFGREHALRNIALACRSEGIDSLLNGGMDLTDQDDFEQYEANMVFLGITGMLDPPRPEVRAAISKCSTAGIRVIVITGDNKNTAEAICKKIGIFDAKDDDSTLQGRSYTGREFDALTRKQQLDAIRTASLFSRTEPAHKQKLVDLLQDDGHIVAMTGDGVNDAPALKKADIGIAMGSGTDVAKLAADMVLADDNFSTIEKAVEEGRSIYNNTKQFIRYLISSNIGEVVSIFLTVLLGVPEALIPVQLLWVNLVTDGLPATALATNPKDHQIMLQPPRNAHEPLVNGWLFFRYLIIGAYVGAATVFGYAWWFIYYEQGPQISFYQLSHFHQCATNFPEIGCQMFKNEMSMKASTMSLSILVVIEMLNAMNSLSENESLLTLPLWTNPWLVLAIALSMALHYAILYAPFFNQLFSILPLNADEWWAVFWISFPVIILDEMLKFVTRTWILTPVSTSSKDKLE
ncbi:SERCA-type calcium-translocating P-type ATPase [Gongronella butleri]|nr:SERCA-type calcium-translocating P-type ATPase [Gongronella butleri]